CSASTSAPSCKFGPMDLGLAGCRVFIAASSSGLGRASAAALAAEGARVVVSGRDAARLEETRASLGNDARAVVGDLSTAEGAARAVGEAIGILGGLDVLVTNCGGPKPGMMLEQDDAAWRAGAELLLISAAAMIRAAAPALKASQGAVVMLASTTVKQ